MRIKPFRRYVPNRLDRIFFPFLLPAFGLYALFLVYPILSSFLYSFTDWHGQREEIRFIGLRNFQKLVTDPHFHAALSNTLVYTLVLVVLLNVLGFLLALGLDSGIRTRNLLRTVFFIPFILSSLVISFVWSYIYGYNGLLNHLLQAVGLGALKTEWLGSAQYTILYVSLVSVWQYVSYPMIIYLAALQSIPRDVEESARIDGASGVKYLRSITLPMIMHAVTINVILSTINGLKVFDIIFVMTKGGPGYATETITTQMYFEAFTSWNFGYGTTIGFVLFLIIMLVTIVQVRIIRRREVAL